MKSILSELSEKIILQKTNDSTNNTTEKMFEEVLHVRASIKALFLPNLYQIVILQLPTKFKNLNITGIKWNEEEYKCIANFVNYKGNFLKGTVEKIS